MEPISIVTTAIIAAVTAGVTGGVTDVGKQAVLDAYGTLKGAIKTKFGKAGKSVAAINELEESPDSKGWQSVLDENLVKEKIHEDMEIVKIARDLIAALKETESGRKALAKYRVDTGGGSVGVIGDNTKIHGGLHFHAAPESQNTDAFTQEGRERFYLERLIDKCDDLELTAIEESCTAGNKKGGLVRVSEVFTTLYLKDMERLENQTVAQAMSQALSPSRGNKDAFSRSGEEKKRFPISAIEAAGAFNRLVILGRPGGGKSTLINHLATQTARIRMGEEIPPDRLPGWSPEEKRLPVRIVLRRFAAWIPVDRKEGTEGLVWDYLSYLLGEWGCREFFSSLKQILDASGGVIFFDGLDEVSEQDARRTRSQIVQAISAFARPLKNCRVIVTCREYAYKRDGKKNDAWRLPDSEFPVVELDLFRSEQIGWFTRTWYRIVGKWRDWNPEKCELEAKNLFEAISSWSHLEELARYPLLLTLMAQVHGRDGYLPKDRADLYDRAVKLLLVLWENRILRDQDGACTIEAGLIAQLGIRTDMLRDALERVALAAHERQETAPDRSGCADIKKEDLRQELSQSLSIGLDKAEEVMAYIQNRAGLIQALDNSTFSFPHRTFQEYLSAACVMKRGDFEDFLRERVLRDLPWWQEVFLLAAGITRNTPRNIYMLVDVLLPDDPDDGTSASKAVDFAKLSARAMAETEFLTRVQEEKKSGPGRFSRIHKRVQNWLLSAMTADGTLSPKERCEAGNALNWVGDPRFDPEHWYLPDEAEFGFIQIPAGVFWMGSDKKKDKNAQEREFPRHRVVVPKFAMAKYPVTVAQYKAFVRDSGLELDDEWNRYNRYDNHPVVKVSWEDAVAYCRWLTGRLKDRGWRARLPSEAEWEIAARGGDERIYPWGGDEIDPNRANFSKTDIDGTSPVGCFPGGASPQDVMDMAGNVLQWVEDDWHENYNDAPVNGCSWIDRPRGSGRVVRGGGWNVPAEYCRSACRGRDVPEYRFNDLGFRLVLSPGQQG